MSLFSFFQNPQHQSGAEVLRGSARCVNAIRSKCPTFFLCCVICLGLFSISSFAFAAEREICGLHFPLDTLEELSNGDFRVQYEDREQIFPPDALEEGIVDLAISPQTSSTTPFSGSDLEHFLLCALDRGEMRWVDWALRRRSKAADRLSVDFWKLGEQVAESPGSSTFVQSTMQNIERTRELPISFLLGFGERKIEWAKVIFGVGHSERKGEVLQELDSRIVAAWNQGDASASATSLEYLGVLFGATDEQYRRRANWFSNWRTYLESDAELRSQSLQTLLRVILETKAPPKVYVQYLNDELRKQLAEAEATQSGDVLESLSGIPLASWDPALDDLAMKLLESAAHWKFLTDSDFGKVIEQRIPKNKKLKSFFESRSIAIVRALLEQKDLDQALRLFSWLQQRFSLSTLDLDDVRFQFAVHAHKAQRQFLADDMLRTIKRKLSIPEKFQLLSIGYYSELPWLFALAGVVGALLFVRLLRGSQSLGIEKNANTAAAGPGRVKILRPNPEPSSDTHSQFQMLRSANMQDVEYEQILLEHFQLTAQSPLRQIKARYRQLVKELHPDLQDGANDPKAVEKFQLLNTAYERVLELRKQLGLG